MAEYETSFTDHGVHDLLGQLETALRKRTKKKLEGSARDNLDRLTQATNFIESRLSAASPVLNTPSKLSQIEKSIQASLNEVNQFHNDENAAHLANAANQIDAGLNASSTLISLEQPTPSIKASDAVGFKKLAEDVIAGLENKASSVDETLAAVNAHIEKLEIRSEQQKVALDSLQSTSEAKLEELESQFQSNQTERSTKFQSKLDELDEAATEYLNKLEEKKAEDEQIVNLVGNVGLTGNFKGAAFREKRSADWLRIVALLCFLGMVCVVITTLFFSLKGGFDPWVALFRLGAGFTLIVPAAYAARESSRHRVIENKNRKAELELASIDAYLESLPAEKRVEIKASLTDKFFGHEEPVETHAQDFKVDSLIGLLKEAITALSKR